MPIFRKKPIEIEAHQWFKNGDHPLDYSRAHEGLDNGESRQFLPEERKANGWEGDIVRFYRNPEVFGESSCNHCGNNKHDHGWIDTLEGGHIVCPGDFIITGIKGEYYPCKPDIFAATYDAVSLGKEGQKPLPDAAVLVEALELISDTDPDEGTAWFHDIAHKALAVYRKGEGV